MELDTWLTSPPITPKEGKADKSQMPFFGIVSSVRHRRSDSIQSYCLERKGGDMHVWSVFKLSKTRGTKDSVLIKWKSRKDYFNTGFYVEEVLRFLAIFGMKIYIRYYSGFYC